MEKKEEKKIKEFKVVDKVDVNFTNKVFQEDEQLRHDPDAEKVRDAYLRITGEKFDYKNKICMIDLGDTFVYVMNTGLVVTFDYAVGRIYDPYFKFTNDEESKVLDLHGEIYDDETVRNTSQRFMENYYKRKR